jgi:septal ring factor EnvC (AmiA/AmiB activator)
MLACCIAAAPVFAATPQEEYEKTSKDIREAKQKQQQLVEENKRLEAELNELQARLVQSAAKVQDAENSLSSYEDKLRILNEQLNEKTKALTTRKKDLDALVQAAVRLSRTPPEAVILMPGEAHQTMIAADVLKMTSESIRKEMESITQQMEELEKLKGKVAKSRSEVGTQETMLSNTRIKLQTEVAERKALLEKLGREQEEQESRIAQLAKKAADLQELMSSIAKEEEAEKAAAKSGVLLKPEDPPAKGKRGSLRSFSSAKGKIRPPVAGRVVQLFGATQANDTNRGVVIATRPQAQVTAAFDGEVVFSGPFLNYGRMVILRHRDDFHTLAAGLAKIDVKVGQFLLEGEPIGAMGSGGASNRLYFELRRNNQPIDPAPWLNGFKKR